MLSTFFLLQIWDYLPLDAGNRVGSKITVVSEKSVGCKEKTGLGGVCLPALSGGKCVVFGFLFNQTQSPRGLRLVNWF